jgi:DNA-directed RNA polymerase specialized sigma24 family protein
MRACARHPGVCTQREPKTGTQAAISPTSARVAGHRREPSDPAEQVALVARAKREVLLRAHRFRLRREDLEDAYSQAITELVAQARGGTRFAGRQHLANVIEQRFLSRIHDRRRALSGRSPMQMALETALPLDGAPERSIEIADARAELERLVILREELQRISSLAGGLSHDQRLLLACQIGLQMGCAEFCRIHGWTPEKYRKVGQRARARLRELMAQQPGCVPPARAASEQNPGTNL